MVAPLFLTLVVLQGPAAAAQIDEIAPAAASAAVPVLATGIRVQDDRAPVGVAAGPRMVRRAPCAYLAHDGAFSCSTKVLLNGTLWADGRAWGDEVGAYRLREVQQAEAKESEARARAARKGNEERRREAARNSPPAPVRSSAAGTTRAGSGASRGEPRSAGSASRFSGGMYTPPERNSAGRDATRPSAPAKRGELH